MRRRRAAALAVLLLLLGAPIIGALVPRPLVGVERAPDGASRRVLVLANPIHTDVALPVDADVLARYGFLEQSGLPLADPRVHWLVVGWGGRSFYIETPTWSDLRPGPALRALTVDRSAMHVAVAGAIDETAEGVTSIDLSTAHFEALLTASLDGFARDAAGQPMLIEGRSYGPYDRFYEGKGMFSAMVGCNTWTGKVLREAGLQTGWWNPLPQSLTWSLGLFNRLP